MERELLDAHLHSQASSEAVALTGCSTSALQAPSQMANEGAGRGSRRQS